MSVTLELSPVEERRLRDVARHRGVRPEELAHLLVSQVVSTPMQSETERSIHEEMTEERRDWDDLTRR